MTRDNKNWKVTKIEKPDWLSLIPYEGNEQPVADKEV